MARETVELFGDKELISRLMGLEAKTGRKVMSQALREGGRPVLEASKQLAPVESGKLRDSLKLRARKSKRRDTFGVEIRTGTRSELGISQDATGFYPMSQEFGWGDQNESAGTAAKAASALSRASGSGGRSGPARPYMRPALDNNRALIERIIRIRTWKGIQDIALAGGVTRTARTR